MDDRYERTLEELRDWVEDGILGLQPIGAASLLSIQEEMRKMIARSYDVPMEWVNLTDMHFSADRRGVICDGFTISPGGLDYIG